VACEEIRWGNEFQLQPRNGVARDVLHAARRAAATGRNARTRLARSWVDAVIGGRQNSNCIRRECNWRFTFTPGFGILTT